MNTHGDLETLVDVCRRKLDEHAEEGATRDLLGEEDPDLRQL